MRSQKYVFCIKFIRIEICDTDYRDDPEIFKVHFAPARDSVYVFNVKIVLQQVVSATEHDGHIFLLIFKLNEFLYVINSESIINR